MIAMKHYIEHFIFCRAVLFSTEKNYSYLHSSYACDAVKLRSHGLDSHENFRSCPVPQTVQDNTSQTCHPITLYHSSNTRITSDVIRATLNSLFSYYWHLCIKRNVFYRHQTFMLFCSGFFRTLSISFNLKDRLHIDQTHFIPITAYDKLVVATGTKIKKKEMSFQK